MDNTTENKRIAKNTVYLYFRQIFVMFVSLYTSRLILKELGVEDFGIYNVIGGVVALLSVFSSSLSSAMSRYYTYELGRRDIKKLELVFSTSLCVLFALSILFLILSEIIGIVALRYVLVIPPLRMHAAFWVLQFSIIEFVLSLFSTPFFGAIIAYEKMNLFAILGIIDALSKLLVVLSLQIFLGDKLILFAILKSLIAAIMLIFYVILCKDRIEGCSLRLRFDKTIFSSLSKYATWSLFGVVSGVGYTYGYNIILNIFFGPIVNAARGIALQVQSAITSFANNFQASLNPQIIKNYACGNIERMHELVYASSRYSFYLMLLLVMPIIIEADYLLNLWLVEVPPHTVNFVRIVLGVICIEVLSGPLVCSQNATGNIKKIQITTGITMLLSLPICYVIFCHGGSPELLYIVYGIFIIINQIIRVIITCPFVGISFSNYYKNVITNIVKVSFISLPFPILLLYICPSSDTLSFILECLICTTSIILAIYYGGINEDERNALSKKIISKISICKTYLFE